MGIFTKSLERRSTPNTTLLSNPAEWLFEAFGAQKTDSGISVTPQNALKYAPVYACVNAISTPIAMMPFDVFRVDDKGKKVAIDRPEHYLIHSEPNGRMSSHAFRKAFMGNVLLGGNFYVEIVRDGSNRPRELKLHPWWNVVVFESLDESRLVYQITRKSGKQDLLDGSDVIHVPCLSLDGMSGLSPISQNREAVGMGLAAQSAGASFFANGSRLSGYLSTERPMRKEDRDDTEKKWFQKFGGSKKYGGTPVLSNGLKYTPLGIPPADAQYIETRNLQAAEIARIFDVPGMLIELAGEGDIDVVWQNFVKRNIADWAQAIEQEFNRKLFPNRDDLYCKFNLNGLLRGDAKARSEFYKAMFAVASLSSDEIRDLEDLNPIEDGKGKRYWIQQGFMPLDRADEILDKQGKNPPQVKQDPQEGGTDSNDTPGARSRLIASSTRSAHVSWLRDVASRVDKWERKSDAKAADAMAPVLASYGNELGVADFSLTPEDGQILARDLRPGNEEEILDRFASQVVYRRETKPIEVHVHPQETIDLNLTVETKPGTTTRNAKAVRNADGTMSIQIEDTHGA